MINIFLNNKNTTTVGYTRIEGSNIISIACNFDREVKSTNNPDGVFPKWNRTFIEFSDFNKFRESDKSMKHELGSI